MANKTIEELDSRGTLVGTDIVPVSVSGVAKQTTVQHIVDLSNEAISGTDTHEVSTVRIRNASAVRLVLERTDAGTDLGKWRMLGDDTDFEMGAMNDAEDTIFKFLQAHRNSSFVSKPDSDHNRSFGHQLGESGNETIKSLSVVSDRFTVAQKFGDGDAPFGVSFGSRYNMPGDIAEEKLGDPTYATSGSWHNKTSWTFGSNKATKSAGDTNPLSIVLVDPIHLGEKYTLRFTISGITAGSVTPTLCGVAGTARSANAAIAETIRLPENFVTNGTFADATGWTDSGSSWSYGTEAITAGAGTDTLTSTANQTIVASTKYRIWFYASVTSGTITPSVGGSTDGSAVATTQPGWFYQDVTSAGSPTQTIVFTSASFVGSIDTVVVIPISLTFTPTSLFDGAISANASSLSYNIQEIDGPESDTSGAWVIHDAQSGEGVIAGRANSAKDFRFNGQDGAERARFGGDTNNKFGVGDYRKGALAHDGTTPFTNGQWLYGVTSGAIAVVNDASVSGTVYVSKISGTFNAAEVLKSVSGATATTNASPVLHMTSLTAELTVMSDDADAASDPTIRIARLSPSPANGDTLGLLEWSGRNDAGQDVVYGSASVVIADVADGTEDSSFRLKLMVAGTLTQVLSITQDGAATIASAASGTLSLISGTTGVSGLFFGDTDVDVGSIRYHHNGDLLITTVGTDEVTRWQSGILKMSNAASWTANGGVTPTLGLGPVGIGTTTVSKWLTIKDDAGTTMYIPTWT